MQLPATILFLGVAATAFGDMRGEVVCGIPPDEAVAYVYEARPGVWRYIGIHGMHYEDRGHPSADEALAAHAPEQAEYVCDVEVEGTPPSTAQLYRLHHSFIPRGAKNEQGEPLDWDYDPRGSILGVTATVASNRTVEVLDESRVAEIYSQAIEDCREGRYDLGYVGFERVAEQGGSLAPQARANMGECRFVQGRLDEALEQLEIVIRDFPGHLWSGLVWFRKGHILRQMGHESDAREIFEDIVDVFPGTRAGRLAQEELDAMIEHTAEADATPLGFCGIPLTEATVVVHFGGGQWVTYEAFGTANHQDPEDGSPVGFLHGRLAHAISWAVSDWTAFPDFHREHRDGGITAEDADCRFRFVGEGSRGPYTRHVLVYRLGQPLQEGQRNAQSFFAEDQAEYLDQMPWGRVH